MPAVPATPVTAEPGAVVRPPALHRAPRAPAPPVAQPPPAAPAEPEPAPADVPAAESSPAPSGITGTTTRSAGIDARLLAAQVALLDRARAEAGCRPRCPASLAVLDDYRTQFPDGALVGPAEAVRIDAMILQGDRAGAAALARGFLARYPRSPLVERVRAQLDRIAK